MNSLLTFNVFWQFKSILIKQKFFLTMLSIGILDAFVFPQPFAIICFAFFFLMDFISGLGVAAKSRSVSPGTALQKTFEKLIQHAIIISIGILASSAAKFFGNSITYFVVLKLTGDVLLWYCVAIEVLSNVLNGIKLNPKSLLSRYLLIPIAKKLRLEVEGFNSKINPKKTHK